MVSKARDAVRYEYKSQCIIARKRICAYARNAVGDLIDDLILMDFTAQKAGFVFIKQCIVICTVIWVILRNIDLRQLAAISKCSVTDMRNACRYIYAIQSVAITKRKAPDACDTVRNCDLLQLVTVLKCGLSNAYKACGKRYIGQSIAGVKCPIADTRYTVAQNDIRQVHTDVECIIAYASHSVGYIYLRQIPASKERISADALYAAPYDDGFDLLPIVKPRRLGV